MQICNQYSFGHDWMSIELCTKTIANMIMIIDVSLYKALEFKGSRKKNSFLVAGSLRGGGG